MSARRASGNPYRAMQSGAEARRGAGREAERAPARPLASAQRKAMMQKVHIARKQLGLDEDTYRAVLAQVCHGKASLTLCSEADLARLLAHFESKGWSANNGKSKRAAHPAARKARALWISLHQLGVVHNASEQALESFARRQLKCDRLVWADQGQMFRLVEALKAMGQRAGWDQSGSLAEIKIALLGAILERLKQAGAAQPFWNVAWAAVEICGLEKAQKMGPQHWEPQEIDLVARQLGARLRMAGKPDQADPGDGA